MNDEPVRVGYEDDDDHEKRTRDGKYPPDDKILDPRLETIQTFEGWRIEIEEWREGRRFTELIIQ